MCVGYCSLSLMTFPPLSSQAPFPDVSHTHQLNIQVIIVINLMSVDCVIFGCLLSAVAGQGELGFIQIVLSLAEVFFNFFLLYFFFKCF